MRRGEEKGEKEKVNTRTTQISLSLSLSLSPSNSVASTRNDCITLSVTVMLVISKMRLSSTYFPCTLKRKREMLICWFSLPPSSFPLPSLPPSSSSLLLFPLFSSSYHCVAFRNYKLGTVDFAVQPRQR